MIITLTPDDIIRRGLWLDYKKFSLRDKNESEIQTIVRENKPVSISEELGYVMGLLKVIETDNLIHRFSTHLVEILKIKSNIFDKNVYISVKIIENELQNFRKRFPDYWQSDTTYEKAIKNLNKFIDDLEGQIKDFQIFEFKVKDKKVKYYQSKDIKNLIGD